jgi:Flp pilus assembly pilin Flp
VKFLSDERGQDLTEYTLLLAFVVLASAALLILNAQSVKGIWTSTNTMILTANNAAQGGTS